MRSPSPRSSSTTPTSTSRLRASEIGRSGSETLTLDYPWQEGSPLLVTLLTSTGATVEHTVEVAVETPEADAGFYGLMALLGTYVGVIPVALGMLFLPFLGRVRESWIRVFMAVDDRIARLSGRRRLSRGQSRSPPRARARSAGSSSCSSGRPRPTSRSSPSTATCAGAMSAPGRPEPAPSSFRCSSPSGSGFTTSARASRSGPHTRSESWRSAPSWSSALRCTTRPRGLRSWLRSPEGSDLRSAASRCSG